MAVKQARLRLSREPSYLSEVWDRVTHDRPCAKCDCNLVPRVSRGRKREDPGNEVGTTEYSVLSLLNRPFPSCFEPHYESEAKCKVFVMKISFLSNANKTNFHMKSFALASLS